MPPELHAAMLQRARELLQAGNPAAAEALCRNILVKEPRHAGAVHWLGVIALSTGRFAESLQWIGHAIALSPGEASYHSDLGAAHRMVGQLDLAVACFRRALELEPDHPDAQQNLGEALIVLGRHEEALPHCERAVELRPESVSSQSNLATVLARLGDPDRAKAVCRRALELEPRSAVVRHNLGVALLLERSWDEALAEFEHALAIEPAYAEAICHRGVARLEKSRRELPGSPQAARELAAAVADFEAALALQPGYLDALEDRGIAFSESARGLPLSESAAALRRLDQALACFGQALSRNPLLASAWQHRAGILAEQARWKSDPAQKETLLRAAVECSDRALVIQSGSAEAFANRGVIFHGLGKLAQDTGSPAAGVYFRAGLSACDRAIALQPSLAAAHVNRGQILWQEGNFAEAEVSYRAALHFQPDHPGARWNLATLLFFRGAWAEGWPAYEARLRCPDGQTAPFRDFPAPRWQGESLTGKTLLVHADQGFGDTLQFFRYLAEVRAQTGAARVLFECTPALLPLLRQNAPEGVEIFPRETWDGRTLPPFDFHLPQLSLPFALGSQPPLLDHGHHLIADPARREQWRERLGSSRSWQVGLVWAGNQSNLHGQHRTLPFESLQPLLKQGGVTFHSLQVPALQSTASLAALGITDHAAELRDFADTAALIGELDLVISIDSAVAHLAGSLGKPVWTLLAFLPDWRWGFTGESTPWYSGMRLFRQRSPGDWGSVVAEVADALQTAVGSLRS